MDEGAAHTGAGVLVDLVERLQVEHAAGVDRIGVGKPGADLGDRQGAWARRQRRAGARFGCGLHVARPVEQGAIHLPAARRTIGRGIGTLGRKEGLQAHDPAGGHAGRTLGPLGVEQHGAGRAGGLDEIMGGLADPLFGRG